MIIDMIPVPKALYDTSFAAFVEESHRKIATAFGIPPKLLCGQEPTYGEPPLTKALAVYMAATGRPL